MKYLSKIAAQNNEMDIPDKKSQLFSLNDWKFNFIGGSDLVLQTIDDNPVLNGGNAQV